MMRGYEILEEQRRGQFPTQEHVEWFASRGIASMDMFMTWDGFAHPLRLDRVVFLRNGRFEFERHLRRDREGVVTAYTVVIRNDRGFVADIAAWHPKSDRLATWLGRCAMLGEDDLYAARLREALRVHLDPIGWFRERRQGVVIVNEAAARPLLLQAGPLHTASVGHGRALLAMLSEVRLPTVLADDTTEDAA
ncbi:hypothetical protein VQ02_19820 [Methylobacterium variabile]|uniref:Uncharacterized protein n=1 Tax=Methylobacterium variabile TaxID=298794 RepID=A0A0J6V4S2_9HYPH|nr:hypothetical protein [Methylobacterium variabile]KMO33896.1 hypothetical protein VQ02_19820 [Methylobacterium variabile]